MKHLTVISPDLKSTEKIVSVLRKEKVADQNIYVITKQVVKPEEDDLFDEVSTEATETMLGGVLGGTALGVLGFLTELPAFIFAGGIMVATGTLISATVLEAGFIAWLTGLFSRSDESEETNAEKIAHYKEAIESGKTVVIADIPEEKFPAISRAIAKEPFELQLAS